MSMTRPTPPGLRHIGEPLNRVMEDLALKMAARDLYDALDRLLNDPVPSRQYVLGHPAAKAALAALAKAEGRAA